MPELDTRIRFTENDTEKAFQLAKQNQLPVLVDFWALGCKGCKKMEITTYQNHGMLSYINKNFVFVKYDITNRNAPKIQSSPILWTPTFIIFANDGSEVKKITGYLNDQLFEAETELGRALAFLRKSKAKKSSGDIRNLHCKNIQQLFSARSIVLGRCSLLFFKWTNCEKPCSALGTVTIRLPPKRLGTESRCALSIIII